MPLGLGMQSQLGIGIAISLQDKFSPVADRVFKKLNMLKASSRGVVDSAIRDYAMRSAAVAGGAALITRGFYSMAKSASEFGHKINQVDILGEGKLGKTKKQLSDFAMDMGRQFATMPKDVADAMAENTRAGVTTGLDEITKYQLAVSKATDESVQSVSGVLLGAASAYNIPMTQFGRVANTVTAIANATRASVSSIGESLEYTAFTAKQFNIPFEQTVALVGRLAQNGIMGSSAGTALNNMMQYIGTSTSALASPKQIKMWEMLGIDRRKVAALNDAGKIGEVVDLMDKAMAGMAPGERTSILRGLTNMRGGRGMMGLWGGKNEGKDINSLWGAALGGVKNDIAMKQSQAMMNDPYSQFARVQVAWEQFKIKWMGAMAPALMVILKGAEKVITWAGNLAATPLGSVLGTIVAVGAPLVTVIFGLRAAALAATLALRTIGGGMGFKQLFGAGLGMAGGRAPRYMSFAGIKGSGVNPNYNAMMGKVNQAGNGWRVAAGQTLSHGGRNYTGGQILPRSFNPGTPRPSWGAPLRSPGANLMGAGTGMMSLGGAVGAGVSRGVGPMMGRMLGVGLKVVPVVGTALTIATVLWSIYDLLKGDKEKEQVDPTLLAATNRMKENMFNYMNPVWANIPKVNIAEEKKKILEQNIILNVDGTEALRKGLKQYEDNFQNNLQFNFTQ